MITSTKVQKSVSIRFLRKPEFITPENLSYFIPNYDFTTPIDAFDCSSLNIKSLLGGPQTVNYYDCSYCDLITLEGSPSFLKSLNCSDNKLTSLNHCPTRLEYMLECSDNKIKSLSHAPKHVEIFKANNNKIISLAGIGKKYLLECESIEIKENPITSNILGLFLVKGLKEIIADRREVFDIVIKHFNKGKDILACQEELIAAGYKEYARL